MIRKILPLSLLFSLLATALAFAGGDAPAKPAPQAGKITAAVAASVLDNGEYNRVGILRTTNKAQFSRYAPRAFEIKHANPFELAYFLRPTIRAEAGIIGTWMNMTEGATGGVLLVVAPEDILEQIGDFVKQADIPKLTASSGTYTRFVHLAHRTCLEPEAPMSLMQYSGQDTEIFPDPDTNGFYLVGAKSGVESVVNNAAQYDVPTASVSISVKVYEIDASNDGSLGLDFQAWKNGPGHDLFAVGMSGYHVHTERMQARSRGYSSSYNLDYPSEFFDALTVKGKAQILTEAKVTVLSTMPAEFRSVEQILFYPVDTVGNTDRYVDSDQATRDGDIPGAISGRATGARASERATDFVYGRNPRPNAPLTAEAGIVLEVTPLIGVTDIDMEVSLNVNTLVGFEDNGVPSIATRKWDTRVRAANGEEVILGKMNRARKIQTTRKIPVLGSIPVLGYFFGGEINAQKNTSVIAAITPTLIESGGEITPSDQEVINQVAGGDIALPADEYAFEQYGLDD